MGFSIACVCACARPRACLHALRCNAQVDAWLYSDHQRYFFFQTMSTVGALLLLMVHGPGTLSMDEQNGPLQIITTKGDA